MFDIIASANAIAKAHPNTPKKKVNKVTKGLKKPSAKKLLEQKALKKFGKFIKVGGFHKETITMIGYLQKLGKI